MKAHHTGIILIGGSGARFGSKTPKQFLPLGGKEIYQYTVEAMSPHFDSLLAIVHPDHIDHVRSQTPNLIIVPGGTTRQASVYAALRACPQKTTHVCIHDGVRPFLSPQIIRENKRAAEAYGAADTCIPTADTIVMGGDTITSIPDRSLMLRGQTPQSFRYELILKAHETTTKTNATDDCQLVHDLGHPVHIVEGSERNIKITTELDLIVAEQLLRTSDALPKPQNSLTGKRFAITGGMGDIGLAIASQLHEAGAIPLPLSRSSKQYPVDLTSPQQTANTFASLGPLDGLINCVGLLSVKPFSEHTQTEIDTLISTNFTAPINACSYANLSENAHIINISSSSYTRGRKNYALYSACKAALVNFTQALAEEHPEHYINALIPHRTDTKMRRTYFTDNPESLLTPQEVAKTCIDILKSTQTGQLYEIKRSEHVSRTLDISS